MPALAKKQDSALPKPASNPYLEKLRAKKQKKEITVGQALTAQGAAGTNSGMIITGDPGGLSLYGGASGAITMNTASSVFAYRSPFDNNLQSNLVQKAIRYATDHMNEWVDTDDATTNYNSVDTAYHENLNETNRQALMQAATLLQQRPVMGSGWTTGSVTTDSAFTVRCTLNTGTAVGYDTPYTWTVNGNLLVKDEEFSPILNHKGKPVRSLHKATQFDDANPAEILALQLLRRMIPSDDFRHYLRHGFVSVQGDSGLIYQVCRQETIKVWDQGELVASLCVHLNLEGQADGKFRSAPPTDHVVAKMLIIQHDEDDIWERSNATWYTKDRNRKSLEQVGQAA